MKKYGTLFTTGMALKSNMTIKAYDWQAASPFYDENQSGPLLAVADSVAGRYFFEVLVTGRYTIILTKADSTTQVLQVGVWLEGEDEVQYDPRS